VRTRCTRRQFLTATGAAGILVATGCSSGTPGKDGAINIAHAFGKTTVPVPIATTEWFGGEPFAVWPWARTALGTAQPQVLSLADGIQIDRIAALKPDLIIATNAGVDAQTYERLSAVAPTIPQSGSAAFFEQWQDQALTIATAAFQRDAMKSLVTAVEDKFVAAGEQHQQFKDKKAVMLQGTPWQGAVMAASPGWRTDFLTQMGFVTPENLGAFTDGDRARIPLDQLGSALDDADVVIWTTESEAEQAALLADPNVAALRATRQHTNVFTNRELAAAIAFSSPLSLPLVADQLPPLLATALPQ
jgi:iron complex transport system substrate-binding protein